MYPRQWVVNTTLKSRMLWRYQGNNISWSASILNAAAAPEKTFDRPRGTPPSIDSRDELHHLELCRVGVGAIIKTYSSRGAAERAIAFQYTHRYNGI